MTELRGKRVLVVEDESLVAMLFEDTLEEIGCEVAATVSRIEEAARTFDTLQFDLCILDVNLNDRQTFGLAEDLRRRGVPFIFATGYGDATLPENLRQVPRLRKPFQRHDLRAALLAALGAQGQESAAPTSP